MNNNQTPSFYCCKGIFEDWTIEEWNEKLKALEMANIPQEEKTKQLFPDYCKEQCFRCMAVVGETRRKRAEYIKQA